MTTTIAITPGCPAGIGPEVVARAVVDAKVPARTQLWFAASAALLLEGARRARVPALRSDTHEVTLGRGRKARRVRCAVADVDDAGAGVRAGVVTDAALACQRDALLRAIAAAAQGAVQGIVTGPVRKKALVVRGRAYPGQTELLHERLHADGDAPLMLFAGGPFLLGLATTHVPLSQVSQTLTPARLLSSLLRLHAAAVRLRRRAQPRMVVLGVNPHAGEDGLLGHEERDVVEPVLTQLRARGLRIEGPVPGDGFFARVGRGEKTGADAVLAMHHDQGLAPYKLLCAGEGIHITWGLRVPRTSPDHGTGDAIAGKHRASAASMTEAVTLCARLA